jgi:hypothetical protein
MIFDKPWLMAGLPAAIACFALVAGGCGSSGDDDDGSSQSNDEASVKATFSKIEDSFALGDGKAYCSLLTPAARAQETAVTRSTNCVRGIKQVARLNRSADLKQRPAKVLSVKVNGDRAVIVVRDPGRASQKAWFVKLGGQWRMDAAKLADTSQGSAAGG